MPDNQLRRLTGKQIAFIDQYLVDFNATRAAERAGYKGDENTLAVTGHENLRNPKIAEAISKRTSESAMPADEVLKRLADQARASMGDFVSFDKNGDPYFDLPAACMMGKLNLAKKLKTKTRSWSEPTFNLTTGEIEQREVTETAIEFELYDAQAALVHIGKHHKLFADKLDVNVTGLPDYTADERAKAEQQIKEWQEQQKKNDAISNG